MTIEINDENYFTVYEALHIWLTLNHDGLGSEVYTLLSKSEFKAGPMWTGTEALKDELVQLFYDEINESNYAEIFCNLTKFLNEQESK